jgi:hypothetical protein
MELYMEFLFRGGAGYDELVERIKSNPKFAFTVAAQARVDKRTTKAKLKGWTKLAHKGYQGQVKLVKDQGYCRSEIHDEAGGKLLGAWTSWIARNASDLVCGMDLRIGQ